MQKNGGNVRPNVDPERYRNPDADPRGAWLACDLTVRFFRPLMIFEFLGSMPPEGRSWRFRRERIEALLADDRIVLRPGRRPVLKRYLADDLGETTPALDSPPELLAVTAVVRKFASDLARSLALNPGQLAEMEWRDLERALAAAFEGIGYRTRLTRSSKDGGFDMELFVNDETFLVEVKHWSVPSRVGSEHVRKFAEVVVRREANRGLFLSSSGFRSGVITESLEIEPARVALGDGRKIIGLCQRYVEAERGVWCPASELPELLFLDVLR